MFTKSTNAYQHRKILKPRDLLSPERTISPIMEMLATEPDKPMPPMSLFVQQYEDKLRESRTVNKNTK